MQQQPAACACGTPTPRALRRGAHTLRTRLCRHSLRCLAPDTQHHHSQHRQNTHTHTNHTTSPSPRPPHHAVCLAGTDEAAGVHVDANEVHAALELALLLGAEARQRRPKVLLHGRRVVATHQRVCEPTPLEQHHALCSRPVCAHTSPRRVSRGVRWGVVWLRQAAASQQHVRPGQAAHLPLNPHPTEWPTSLAPARGSSRHRRPPMAAGRGHARIMYTVHVHSSRCDSMHCRRLRCGQACAGRRARSPRQTAARPALPRTCGGTAPLPLRAPAGACGRSESCRRCPPLHLVGRCLRAAIDPF